MSFADSLSTMDEGCERAILVGIQLKGDDASTLTSSLEELARLTDTAGAEVVATTYQKLDAPNPRTFVGSGKAEEIAEMCHAYAADIVIFDDELTPSQQSNLEKAVPKDVKVIDRTALILDIFALHATTKEGRLQVRLAQNQYLLPRLRGMWAHLASNRMGGGVGSRFGEGESPGRRRFCNVAGSKSATDAPPDATCALSKPFTPRIGSSHASAVFVRRSAMSAVICPHRLLSRTPQSACRISAADNRGTHSPVSISAIGRCAQFFRRWCSSRRNSPASAKPMPFTSDTRSTRPSFAYRAHCITHTPLTP